MQSGRSRGQSGASLPKPLPRLVDAGPKQFVNVDDADRPAVLDHESPFIVPIVVDEGRVRRPPLSLGDNADSGGTRRDTRRRQAYAAVVLPPLPIGPYAARETRPASTRMAMPTKGLLGGDG